MFSGTIKLEAKTSSIDSVWPVRSGQSGAYNNAAIWATGQIVSYAAGDDGALQKGVAWPNPRFNDNGNQTVTDNLTGLVWSKNATTPSIAGGAERCMGGTKTWQGALDYIKCINTAQYLGYSDWRLPNRKELISLIDRATEKPSLPSDNPFLVAPVGEYYWSSTAESGDAYDSAWVVDIPKSGNVAVYPKYSYLYVWPVRAGQVLFGLSVSKSGTGSGSVTSSDGKINCGNTCTANYISDSSVTLTAKSDAGSTFTGWGGSCTRASSTCMVTMSAARGVIATFTLALTPTATPTPTPAPDKMTLTVTKQGTGDGTVTSSPGTLSWNGKTGTVSFDSGKLVTINAVASAGSTIKSWTDCKFITGSNDCVVEMTTDKAVTVQLDKIGTGTVTYDFDGDGKSDIVFENSATTDFAIWLINGLNHTGHYAATHVDPAWKINSVADFNGDGKADILLQHSGNGALVIWFMDGGNIASGKYVVNSMGSTWMVAGAGDFNGDGKADLLFRYIPTGDIYLWLMDGASITGGGYVIHSLPEQWKIRAVADFDGDGKVDILLQNIDSGDIFIWFMDGSKIASGDFVLKGMSVDWEISAVGDFNGDGKADMLWQYKDTGAMFVWFMDGASIKSSGFMTQGLNGDWVIQ
ncbi:MAG: DUF1566 domain-containing protein [Nitrospirae bacterium]|uniref:Lcl domain-containing protein n=1 Tax=Candidatus Magnetobacterium casense TaxID=1455061 RepID=UPI0009E0B5B9|nr:DUF1566 domain-containing protein [Candidatus Magnetobacterium casensis]MBF0337298.1 DUF1566 domain-containing protein [Nitrospirota bacterium]